MRRFFFNVVCFSIVIFFILGGLFTCSSSRVGSKLCCLFNLSMYMFLYKIIAVSHTWFQRNLTLSTSRIILRAPVNLTGCFLLLWFCSPLIVVFNFEYLTKAKHHRHCISLFSLFQFLWMFKYYIKVYYMYNLSLCAFLGNLMKNS